MKPHYEGKGLELNSNLYLLEEGKSVFSNGLILGISNPPGQASCSGIVHQHIMVFLCVILFVYSFVSFVLLSFGIALFYFIGFIVFGISVSYQKQLKL